MIPEFFDKSRKQLFLFDMDGVCSEHKIGEGQKARDNVKDFYKNKRPIKCVIKQVKKLSKFKNTTVGILSSCNFENQKQQKLEWLKRFMPFLKDENIFIVIWSPETVNKTREEKGKEKGKIIFEIQNKNLFDDIFVIEDRHEFMRSINDMFPNCAHHMSEILD